MTANSGMLSQLRVLDLTDEIGYICGKILADLGAEVIKVEKPDGDDARKNWYNNQNTPDPKDYYFWLAYNTNKKGITLNLETSKGREIFLELVKKTDIVIESFQPAYLDKLGLSYSTLEKVNPSIIMVSITPYGQTGPYRDYLADDINAWAMGGYMYPFGDEDRAPVRIGHVPQAYLHAGSEAAGAAVLALYHREITGCGQHVDVSLQESVARLDMTHKWDMLGINLKRGEWLSSILLKTKYIWPCKDGHVIWNYWIGPAAKLYNVPSFCDWIIKEGFADDYFKNLKLEDLEINTPEGKKLVEEAIEKTTPITIKFFKAHTKKELMDGADERNLRVYPVSTIKDLLENNQLKARGFWKALKDTELGAVIPYPGPWALCSEASLEQPLRVPVLGQHNKDIYIHELGMSLPLLEQYRKEQVI